MPWQEIGTQFLTNKKWFFTETVEGELFRISHDVSVTDEYIKAVVAPAFIDDGINILTPKRLSYRQEKELIFFDIPKGIDEFKLGFKRTDESKILWRIKAEVYVGYSSTENLVDLITLQVNNEMTNIYSRGSDANLQPRSGFKDLPANTGVKIIDSKEKRTHLTIRVGAGSLTLCASLDTAGAPVSIIEVLQAGEVFTLPIANGIYKGDIWGVSPVAQKVSFTEYTT